MTKLCNKIITLKDRRTSMRLCLKEWSALEDVCLNEKISRNILISLIEDNKNPLLGLTYATRLFLLLYYRTKIFNPKETLENIMHEIA